MILRLLLLLGLFFQFSSASFGPCRTCVFVLERIKRGTNVLLPSICSELFTNFPASYSNCHQVLNAISLNGNNVRYWLFEGCYKYEIYNAKEWVKPCPSHVMCSVLRDLKDSPFCAPLPMEDPFSTGEDAGGSGGAGGGGQFFELHEGIEVRDQNYHEQELAHSSAVMGTVGTVGAAGAGAAGAGADSSVQHMHDPSSPPTATTQSDNINKQATAKSSTPAPAVALNHADTNSISNSNKAPTPVGSQAAGSQHVINPT